MTMQQCAAVLRSSAWLLYADVNVFMRDWQNNLLNAIFWPLVLILSNGYIMPAMGLSPAYGAFNTTSMLIIMASFTAWNAANNLVADFEGARAIGYELTLPIPYQFVCLKIVLNYAFRAALFNLMALAVGKIILGSAFSLAAFHLGKFVIAYLLSCLLFGAFAFWAASCAGTISYFTNLEIRLAGPLFFICGYSYPWKVLHTISPFFGKLMLCAPWLYAYEGVRATILGPENCLPYPVCIIMLSVFSGLFLLLGMRAFKRQLDCV
jgi:hypothetical protein